MERAGRRPTCVPGHLVEVVLHFYKQWVGGPRGLRRTGFISFHRRVGKKILEYVGAYCVFRGAVAQDYFQAVLPCNRMLSHT